MSLEASNLFDMATMQRITYDDDDEPKKTAKAGVEIPHRRFALDISKLSGPQIRPLRSPYMVKLNQLNQLKSLTRLTSLTSLISLVRLLRLTCLTRLNAFNFGGVSKLV